MENDFVEFCRQNKKKILKTIEKAARSIPPILCSTDYRFDISGLVCCAFESAFKKDVFLSLAGCEYDLLFNKNIRISVKILQSSFQKEKMRGQGLTKPPYIILRNCLGEVNDSKAEFDIDYLLVIQRGLEKDGITSIGFGVVSRENFDEMSFEYSSDQIKINIENEQYNFFSGLKTISLEKSDELKESQNRKVVELKKQYFKKLIDFCNQQ